MSPSMLAPGRRPATRRAGSRRPGDCRRRLTASRAATVLRSPAAVSEVARPDRRSGPMDTDRQRIAEIWLAPRRAAVAPADLEPLSRRERDRVASMREPDDIASFARSRALLRRLA